MSDAYDVVIVGARVAGAGLALLLGERGHRVLMIDRDTFPSETLSTHFVSSFGVPTMQKLGILDDILAAGFRKVTRTRTWVDDCLVEGPAGPNGAFGLSPRRDALDAIVIRHAIRRGCVDFLDKTTVDALITEDDRVVGVSARMANGERREFRAKVVVGADGKYSKVAQWVNAYTYEETPGLRPMYYGHYFGVEPLDEPALEISFVGEQIGFMFPMRPDEDCLGLEVLPDDFEAFRRNPHEAFEERYRALPGIAKRMRKAQLDGKIHGARSVANYLRKPYGPGWALTGDAGYLKDPSTGLGITDAFQSAFRLASALDKTLRNCLKTASKAGKRRHWLR